MKQLTLNKPPAQPSGRMTEYTMTEPCFYLPHKASFVLYTASDELVRITQSFEGIADCHDLRPQSGVHVTIDPNFDPVTVWCLLDTALFEASKLTGVWEQAIEEAHGEERK